MPLLTFEGALRAVLSLTQSTVREVDPPVSLSMTSTFIKRECHPRGASSWLSFGRRSYVVAFHASRNRLGWLGCRAHAVVVLTNVFSRTRTCDPGKGRPPCHQPCRWHRIAGSLTCRAASKSMGWQTTPLTAGQRVLERVKLPREAGRARVAGEINRNRLARRAAQRLFNASLEQKRGEEIKTEATTTARAYTERWPMAAKVAAVQNRRTGACVVSFDFTKPKKM